MEMPLESSHHLTWEPRTGAKGLIWVDGWMDGQIDGWVMWETAYIDKYACAHLSHPKALKRKKGTSAVGFVQIQYHNNF